MIEQERNLYIDNAWNQWAALAWSQYQAAGRGVVCLLMSCTHADPYPDPGAIVNADYLADGSEKLQQLGGWPSTDIAENVKNYNPAREVIFCFVWSDGQLEFALGDCENARL